MKSEADSQEFHATIPYMTSFIIVSRDKDTRIAYEKDFCTKQEISPFDVSLIEKETSVKQNVSSIGIDDIKQLHKTVFLKPLKSKQKAVILEDAHLLTTEAQNALLKILEEPPEHTLLILGTKSKDDLLPTILSRCQIIQLETEALELTTRERNSITQFVEELPTMTIGDKLKKAELLAKDKDKALEWTEKVIIVLRETMLLNLSKETAQTIQEFQTLHKLLKTTNVNPRLAIEHTLLSV